MSKVKTSFSLPLSEKHSRAVRAALLDCEIECWRLISTLRRLRALLMREELALRKLDLILWSATTTLRREPAKGSGDPAASQREARGRGNGSAV